MIRRRYVVAPACVAALLVAAAVPCHAAERPAIPSNVGLSPTGRFICRAPAGNGKVVSSDGRFSCDYRVARVGDEVRDLRDIELFENGRLLYHLDSAPGSDLSVSNAGIVAFMDTRQHYRGETAIHFYSREGAQLLSEAFTGVFVTGFSETGNVFGVGTPEGVYVVSVPERRVAMYERGFRFAVSEDENLVAVAPENRVLVYADGSLLRDIETGLPHTRAVAVSSEQDLVAVIGKRRLLAYSLSDGTLLASDTVEGNLSFRDLLISDGRILAGIHYRDDEISEGILRVYDLQGNVVSESREATRAHPKPRSSTGSGSNPAQYDQIPWPFAPFDSMHTVWNYYEQHNSYGTPDWSYLHQGLDLIVPMNEPTYAVADGMVKCVLTIGEEFHWRIATSAVQVPGYSDGWLYAHLVEESIQFDVGDTVRMHDYLGDIIWWYEDWGHIHFVEIRDSGLVWLYSDNEWGINYNPLLSLTPDTDSIPPVIENVFPDSKFGFCLNETSTYLDPDSLYGDIDIITRVVDYVGDSEWQQPAYRTYYWVKSLPDEQIVFQRTLGQILNHSYGFYSSGNYEPYATLLYKRDEYLVPSYWMETERNYYHILTNNDGDSLAALSEKQLAFPTGDYPDGDYRIFVEVFDEYGNSDLDSMDVQFKNPITEGSNLVDAPSIDLMLAPTHPNPFDGEATVLYSLPGAGFVTLRVYDLVGREVERLVDGHRGAGRHALVYRPGDVPAGVYLLELRIDNATLRQKLMYVQ
jgi:hypothetical protein